MKWLEEFKIALVQKNYKKIDELSRNLPTFEKVDEMITASALLESAKEIIKQEQKELSKNMSELKRSRKFFESANYNSLKHAQKELVG